ncbi:MAG: cysteine--tRNA ligase [Flavobacteriales bacterium]|jgi:cysteinyl-tRNA synthetase|nr:cysteine--tRNA ligase [Flavobacteriales bacterium]
MSSKLHFYNTVTKKKEEFKPMNPPFVGMYVCGPTVYGDAHLGHARSAITFDIVYRYLKHLSFKVRYVRNITDVGHLENDADHGEDKIAKKARLEQLEPMEVVQHYKDRYHKEMDALNNFRPSIEPQASGHIIEQIAMTESILEKGFAYVADGSVYFDVEKYAKTHDYGKLSGRKIEDLQSNSRTLEGQDEKRSPLDFALWKKASPEHIMRWPSPWSDGFPGWHIECSVMSSKYLGNTFDIHGGGMDLLFPHHECEIAQSVSSNGEEPVKYWLHNNMITLNGQKMAKSLGNTIMLHEFFSGENDLLEKAYSPLTIRFFILQAHYRSTLDFGNEPLQAAEKGYSKLKKAYDTMKTLSLNWGEASKQFNTRMKNWEDNCQDAMNDDMNTALTIASLFDMTSYVNALKNNQESQIPSKDEFLALKQLFSSYFVEVLGLDGESEGDQKAEVLDDVMKVLIGIRDQAKQNKDYGTADSIRDNLNAIGITIMDSKNGSNWQLDV